MDFIGLVLSFVKGKYLDVTLQNKGSDLFEKTGSLENQKFSEWETWSHPLARHEIRRF
jgi:hypothetical protein